MTENVDRVYDAGKAARVLEFKPKYDYEYHMKTDYAEFDLRHEERPYL